MSRNRLAFVVLAMVAILPSSCRSRTSQTEGGLTAAQDSTVHVECREITAPATGPIGASAMITAKTIRWYDGEDLSSESYLATNETALDTSAKTRDYKQTRELIEEQNSKDPEGDDTEKRSEFITITLESQIIQGQPGTVKLFDMFDGGAVVKDVRYLCQKHQ